MSTGDPAGDAFNAQFVSMLGALDKRPRLVVDYDLSVAWCSDNAAEVINRSMPIALRKSRLTVDEELKPAFLHFLHGVGPQVERKILRGKSKERWAAVRAWKPESWTRRVCVLVCPPLPLENVTESGLARELNLTAAEARVLEAFVELHPPTEIARTLGVSLSTVRSQLKTIYAKASVSSALELMRLAQVFCAA